jgi:HEPN domain-containing protein
MYEPHARLTATAFLEAYRRCMADTPETSEAMFIPALACAAFSAEVGLKSLLIQAGKPARGHDLLALFKQLPITNKTEITRLVGLDMEALLVGLTSIKDAFPEWRYMYEFTDERMINIAFVAKFADAVIRVNPLIGNAA